MNDKIFQGIMDELSEYLDFEWEKLVVYLEYGKASYSFCFYLKTKDGYIKCYDIPDISEEKLNVSFAKIDKLISKERAKEKNELWTNMTLTILPNGKMHADWDYTDLSEGTYLFKKNWKKKYLG